MAGGILHLENKIFFQFQIAGVEVPSSINLFRECTIQEGFGITVPTMQLVLNDNHSFIVGDSSVNDGTRISVRVGKNPESAEDMEFVIFGIKHRNEDNGNALVLNCVIDSSKYTHEAGRDFTDGSSIDAIKAAFSAGGFTTETSVSTSDNMRWMNCGLARSQYVQHVALHSFNGEQSCIAIGIGFHKTAYIRDLFEELGKTPVRTYTYSNSTDNKEVEGTPILIEDVRPFTISGVFNNTINYGHKFRHHSLQDFDSPLEYDEANPQVFGAGLPLNSDIKGEVEQSKYSWGIEFDAGAKPLNAFNVHKEYYKAKYLNTRHLSLFTEGIRVGMETYMENLPKLGEPVKYLQADNHGEDNQNSRYNGKYILGGRILMLNNSHYYEVHELYRSFIEEEGQTNVVGGSSNGSGNSGSGHSGSNGVGADGGDNLDSNAGFGGSAGGSNDLINGQIPKSDGIEDKLPEDVVGEGTGNLTVPKIPSVEDKVGEAAGDIAGADDPLSDFEEGVKELEREHARVQEQLKSIGEKYKSPELEKKYGQDANYLEAVSREMASAKDALAACQHLLDSQLYALQFSKLNAGSMFKDLNSSADAIENGLGNMGKTVNDMLSKGTIPETTFKTPKVDLDCLGLTEDAINSGLKDLLPSNCSNKFNLGRIDWPRLDLGAGLDDIEDWMRDLLCTFGNDIEKGDPGASIRKLENSLSNRADSIASKPGDIADSIKNIG